MIPRIPIRTYSLTHMSPNRTTFLTYPSILFARSVVLPSTTVCHSPLLQSLINAISRIRFENGKSPNVVRKFLIDQLRYNDNTSNAVSVDPMFFLLTISHSFQYADGFYICTIISAAAYATVSTASPERGELLPAEVRTEYNDEDADLLKQSLAEVDRYRSMDRLIPSTHNNVTIAALEVDRFLLLQVPGTDDRIQSSISFLWLQISSQARRSNSFL